MENVFIVESMDIWPRICRSSEQRPSFNRSNSRFGNRKPSNNLNSAETSAINEDIYPCIVTSSSTAASIVKDSRQPLFGRHIEDPSSVSLRQGQLTALTRHAQGNKFNGLQREPGRDSFFHGSPAVNSPGPNTSQSQKINKIEGSENPLIKHRTRVSKGESAYSQYPLARDNQSLEILGVGKRPRSSLEGTRNSPGKGSRNETVRSQSVPLDRDPPTLRSKLSSNNSFSSDLSDTNCLTKSYLSNLPTNGYRFYRKNKVPLYFIFWFSHLCTYNCWYCTNNCCC
jgi:hypothetical protein